ncbi:MAG: type IX secretion system membrane protein PorP/SprF [Cyclobacteriaceae bacterium]|nr:type IX secretion system membrane protein PorP/SprF [Cyclobacteriaceae bacterium]
MGFLLISTFTFGQDIPLFSQKMTNSFVYNPALAGNTFGSITYSHRSNLINKVEGGSITNNFFSVHTPISNYKFGVGGNFFMEDINHVLRNIYGSAAFAYHLSLGGYNTLSLGVSAEYNSLGIRSNATFTGSTIESDPILERQGESNMDFSFGVNYQTKYFKAGIAANRLATNLIRNEEVSILSEFYTGYAAGVIPLRGDQDILEPTFTFRRLSASNNSWDLGLYYTFNNMILIGGAYRRPINQLGNITSITAGFQVNKKLLLGYTHELASTELGGYSEITLRYDFAERDPRKQFKSDYKNSMAYRRKTLSKSSSARKKVGVKGPKSSKKRSKKAAKYSPNRRYNKSNKLNTVKHKGLNTKKRRKQNYKHNKKKYKHNKSKGRRYR